MCYQRRVLRARVLLVFHFIYNLPDPSATLGFTDIGDLLCAAADEICVLFSDSNADGPATWDPFDSIAQLGQRSKGCLGSRPRGCISWPIP
jgi:hypothetical protein